LGELPVQRRTIGDIISNKETYDTEDDQGIPRKGQIVVRCMKIWKMPYTCGSLTPVPRI